MKKVLLFLLLVVSMGFSSIAEAHRSGCHRWHSCPSDTGSYVCGDLGYTSECPQADPPPQPSAPIIQTTSVAPPKNLPETQPNPPVLAETAPVTSPSSYIVPSVSTYYTGIPSNRAELSRCLVVGNRNSHIYHLKGSKFIPKMSVKSKKCFATESDATVAGFRKSKVR